MAKKIALLIGIDEYANYDEDGQLDGCVNDSILMKYMLRDQFGFEEPHIEELHNEAATRDGILSGMERLLARAENDDIIVFHYSGHGSQRTSAHLEDGTGMDSIILPHDNGGEPLPNLGIADYEINEWLGRLSEKSSYITLVFDCCHSGTMTRDAFGAKTRSLPPDTRSLEDMGVKSRSAPSQGTVNPPKSGASGILDLSDSYVVMSGCLDNELASEHGYQSNGKHIATGAMTYFLISALRQAKPGSTYRDVFELAKQNLLRTIEDQHPQIEGRLDREIFGVKDIVPLRFIPLSSVEGDKVVLAGGLAHGLTEKSIWHVYPRGTKQTRDTSPAGQIVITKLAMLTSEGAIIEGTDALVAGARCVEKEPAPDRNHLQVDLSALDNEARAKIDFRIEQSFLLSLSTQPSAAAFRLYMMPARETSTANSVLPQIGRIDQPSWAVVNREGELAMPLNATSEDDAIDKVLDNLETVARYRNGLNLNNPKSKLDIEFNIYRVTDDGQQEDANSGDFEFTEGDYLAFKIINNSDQHVFANILDFGLSGKISQMHPRRRAGELIEAGRTLNFGTGKSKIRLGIPEKPLFKHETFKAFISNKEADFSWLEQDGMRSIVEPKSNLQKRFEAALRGDTNQDGQEKQVEEQKEDWVAISRSFKLRK